MRVDHPRDDEEPGAVDVLRVVGRPLDDPAAGDGDVGAPELARADVDEAVLKEEVQVPAAGAGVGGTVGIAVPSATLATSTTAPGTSSASARRLKARSLRSWSTATSAT